MIFVNWRHWEIRLRTKVDGANVIWPSIKSREQSQERSQNLCDEDNNKKIGFVVLYHFSVALIFCEFRLTDCFVGAILVFIPLWTCDSSTSTIRLDRADMMSFSHVILCKSVDPVRISRGVAGVWFSVSMRREDALLDRIPMNSYLFGIGRFYMYQEQSNKASLFARSFCECTNWLQLPWFQRQVLPGRISITPERAISRHFCRCRWFQCPT